MQSWNGWLATRVNADQSCLLTRRNKIERAGFESKIKRHKQGFKQVFFKALFISKGLRCCFSACCDYLEQCRFRVQRWLKKSAITLFGEKQCDNPVWRKSAVLNRLCDIKKIQRFNGKAASCDKLGEVPCWVDSAWFKKQSDNPVWRKNVVLTMF